MYDCYNHVYNKAGAVLEGCYNLVLTQQPCHKVVTTL